MKHLVFFLSLLLTSLSACYNRQVRYVQKSLEEKPFHCLPCHTQSPFYDLVYLYDWQVLVGYTVGGLEADTVFFEPALGTHIAIPYFYDWQLFGGQIVGNSYADTIIFEATPGACLAIPRNDVKYMTRSPWPSYPIEWKELRGFYARKEK